MEPSKPASPVGHDPESRFGIIHLLGWIGCVAMLISFDQTIVASMPGGAPDFFGSVGYRVQQLAWLLGRGAAVGSLVILAARRWRRLPFPIHSGEFLAVLHGFIFLMSQAIWGVVLFVEAVAIGEPWTWNLELVRELAEFVLFVVFIIWVVPSVRQRRWRVFFFVFALVNCLELPTQFLSWHYLSGYVLALRYFNTVLPVLLVAAVVLDTRTREHRPWTHWLGIGLQVWFWLIEWILQRLFVF